MKRGSHSVGLAAVVLAAGCSAVLPLGPEYTFGQADGGAADAARMDAQGPIDAGHDAGTCEPVPRDVACAERCGEVAVCDEVHDCGGCVGELACGGAGAPNVCGCASPPCATWSAAWGDVAAQGLSAIAADRDGNLYLFGSFRGTLTVGADVHTNPGARWDDVFLVKLDPTGEVVWSRSWGAAEDGPTTDRDQSAMDVAVDGAGNVILALESSGGVMNFGGGDLATDGIVIVKLTGDGEHVFSGAYGTNYVSYPTGVAIDPASHDVYVTGNFWGTLRFGGLSSMTAAGTNAYFDMFIVRFGPDGTPRYSNRYGDGQDQLARAIAVSGDSVYVAALFNGTFDFGPPNTTVLSTEAWYSLAIARLRTGSFSHVWSRQLGTDVWEPKLAADASGNLFVSGLFNGALDIQDPPLLNESPKYQAFLAKLGPDGTTAWARQYANLEIFAIEAGPDGSVYLAGTASGEVDLGAGPVPTSGTRDAVIARLDADGNHVWSRVFVAPVGDQTAVGVAPTSSGVWLGIDFEGQVDLGGGEHVTAGGYDVAAARYVD